MYSDTSAYKAPITLINDDYLITNKVPVTIFLTNGVKLEGVIVDCVEFFKMSGVILERGSTRSFVHARAIATIIPR